MTELKLNHTDPTPAGQPFDLRAAVTEATRCVSAYHPLRTFIHCNTLAGLEVLPFEKAMAVSRGLFGSRTYLPLPEYKALKASGRITDQDLEEATQRVTRNSQTANEPAPVFLRSLADLLDERYKVSVLAGINRHIVTWTAAFLDETMAQWTMPDEGGLLVAWRRMMEMDRSLSLHGNRVWKYRLQKLSTDPTEALRSLLDELGVDDASVVGYLQRHIAQMPGWASHLKWRQEHNHDDTLTEYLVIRLFYELHLSYSIADRLLKVTEKPWHEIRKVLEAEGKTVTGSFDATTAEQLLETEVWHEAYEISYRRELLGLLLAGKSTKAAAAPDYQMVFCIDVRSEPVRRLLDKNGRCETFGAAGFFGFPIKFKELGSELTLDLAPALVSPDKNVKEVSDDKSAKRLSGLQAVTVTALSLQKKLKSNLAGAFGLVETFGPWSAFPLIARTFFPRRFHIACESTKKGLSGGTPHTHFDASAFTLEEKAAFCAGWLRVSGLADRLAPVVLLCGHRSQSSNNPFDSSLQCGACGGHPGGTNARFAASILNDPLVREKLKEMGIEVPSETLFIGAEHNTTIDNFELYMPRTGLTDAQSACIETIKADLAAVGAKVRAHRLVGLPRSAIHGLNEPWQRAHDWAQVTPEWGLSGNASFIGAPRELTKDIDLKGRTFLQTYDCDVDPDGALLEQVMTAPLVVAQWINAEFYFSTMDNAVFGSGSKTVQNVVGDFGVMLGASGDLRLGLPWQSVQWKENMKNHHEPMRLLAVLRAPTDLIDKVVAKHEVLRNLVKNRWIHLVALNPRTGEYLQAEDVGDWKAVPGTQN